MKKKNNDLYVIADCSDNSVTLSPDLCRRLKIDHRSKGMPRLFVFRIAGCGEYAFKRVHGSFAARAECPPVSFNPVMGMFGFISLVPTVNLMFYELGIEEQERKMTVSERRMSDDSTIYVIHSGHEQAN